MAHWLISENEKFAAGDGSTVRVFTLRQNNERFADVFTIWHSERSTRCVSCSTALRGMSASCVHVAALKRFLKHGGK